MKWTLLILTSTLTLAAQTPVCQNCCYDELDGGPDLFKRYDQIYSGSVEFLYWAVAEGALDYALKMEHTPSVSPLYYAQGRVEKATYNMDPGFRLGLLYFRAPHYWEVRWQYTRMTSRGSDHTNAPDSGPKYLTGTFPQLVTTPLTSAHSKIHLNYNVFDWFVDRVFFPNPHLRLRVLGGTTLAWLSQNWKVIYKDGAGDSTKVSNRWAFAGAGLKTGTMFDWYWTGDLYMTAQGFFGILMGSYSNKAKILPGPVRATKLHDARPTVTAQMLLGPSYQKNFCSSRLEVFLGYEMNVWFNLQEVYRSSSSTSAFADKETWVNTGLLTLYGITTRVSLDY